MYGNYNIDKFCKSEQLCSPEICFNLCVVVALNQITNQVIMNEPIKFQVKILYAVGISQ